jgi:hypothetical protein
MIQNLFTLKDAVNDALKVMVSSNLLFTPNEWSILTGVAKILKPFDEVTRDISVPKIIHPFPRSFHQSEFFSVFLEKCVLIIIAQF